MVIKGQSGVSPEKRIVELFSQLPDAERKSLLDFAEFLASRCEPVKPVSLEPLMIPRPEEESVVAAMKRLRETYHMLDHSKMLHEASGLMAQHLMQGRPAQDVIDDLERMFSRFFEKLLEESGKQ